MLGPLLFPIFVNDLPGVLGALALLFADDVKMVTQRTQNMNLHSSLSAACPPNLVAGINHLERIQRLATMLVTGIRHLPYEERLQRPGLHSLQR